MKATFFVCLLAVCFTTILAGPPSRGGKGGGCKDRRRSPCADGSAPLCPDGSQPHRNARSPSCSAGARPVCKDVSDPRPRNLRESGDRSGDSSSSSSRSGRDRPRRDARPGRDNDGSEPRSPSSSPRRGGRQGRDRDSAENVGRDGDSDEAVGRDNVSNEDLAWDKDACDADMDGTTRVLMIGACAGGAALTFSLFCCAYCWRRAAILANARAKVHASSTVEGKAVVGCVGLQCPDTHNIVVVGQVVHTVEHNTRKVAAPVSGVVTDSVHVASTVEDAA